jgi:hypothetical protein
MEKAVEFESGGLRLEGLLHEAASPRLAAVVMHPHPQFGGDMHNHVVEAMTTAIAETGTATLRFNFRGTGHSAGSFDGGRGEAEDARAAIAYMRERWPGARVLVAGYSFGAAIAARIAAPIAGDAELAGLVLVSPPSGMVGDVALPEGLRALVVTGERDGIAAADDLRALESADVRVVVVPGADHGWWPGVDRLAAEVGEFARRIADSET